MTWHPIFSKLIHQSLIYAAIGTQCGFSEQHHFTHQQDDLLYLQSPQLETDSGATAAPANNCSIDESSLPFRGQKPNAAFIGSALQHTPLGLCAFVLRIACAEVHKAPESRSHAAGGSRPAALLAARTARGHSAAERQDPFPHNVPAASRTHK